MTLRHALRRPRLVGFLAVAALMPTLEATAQLAPADLILHSGRLWTGDPAAPYAEALAVRGSEIVMVGSDVDVLGLRGDDTRVVDLDGRFVTPGFIDNHTHFNRAGELLLGVNLLEVSDAEGLTRAVGDAADRLPDGAWMTGGMWGAYEQWAMSSTGREGQGGPEAGTFRPDRTTIDPVSPKT